MRKGGDKRGSNRDRKRRKLWMLEHFDPELGPDLARCRLVLHERCLGLLDINTITPDRLDMGGTYARTNIQPACQPCQNAQGGHATVKTLAQLLEEFRYARERWEVRFDLETGHTYRPGIIARERRREKRGGRREITDWLDENPPPLFSDWLSEWHAARREQGVAS